ncbi:PREDICTED: uncharacterized protein LOC109582964 [Amphimedon queenslandica]|uniref:Transposable element P transposase-like RNase H domain-containing protein n=1 Tax=Amphimedon queenslandica TaxID=400682 RepID=A0A1X7UK91_AMPQE|nr:PREDICTED: uncharacterized protein LOC109582964 [Amphimedon queenslandica]XP_019853622.1 PREDICTED: uncharacterized protein LOC109582964 [Amphimedon queenslandica]|eukprot:XP_019853621.1 PREDICTED: uncharacterized protein LOC109582964 [Amphimedon queenslandica]
MSPQSQAMRKQNIKIDRGSSTRILTRHEGNTVVLDSEQDEEMALIHNVINEQCSKDLEDVISEGEKHGVSDKLRAVWANDKRTMRSDFVKDQKKNCTGQRNNRWSYVTIRMALAVFSRSPAAYEALKSFNILQLPSRSTLQAYTGAFLHDAGSSSDSISEQLAQFILHDAERVKKGCKPSMKAGALIFDEVKVIGRLLWNSRSQKIIGLSMTREDLATLADVYQELKDESNQQTSYIMQFLWRDLTSDFDIIGPYYTSCTSFKNKFVYSCVIETIKLFHLHELTTLLLVCDGASSNLTMLKATHGHFGVYSISNEGDDPFTVQPVMINPFDPPNLIYWLICPTHQLKNMINALFSSKSEGTKEFIQQEVSFGWKSILDLWERECRRISSGETRMVPKLKEVHIIT